MRSIIRITCVIAALTLSFHPAAQDVANPFLKKGFHLSGDSQAALFIRTDRADEAPHRASLPTLGYYIGSGFFVGAGLQIENNTGTRFDRNGVTFTGGGTHQLSPFLRYYPVRTARYLGYVEAGYGIVNLGKRDFNRSTSQLDPVVAGAIRAAAGLERQIAPGIMAGARLYGNRRKNSLDDYGLTVGFTTYTGNLAPRTGRRTAIPRGAFVIGGGLAGLTYQRVRRGNFEALSAYVRPSVGYFVTPGFLLEGGLGYAYSRIMNNNFTGPTMTGQRAFNAELLGRYFPAPKLAFAPYAFAGASFQTQNGEQLSGSQNRFVNATDKNTSFTGGLGLFCRLSSAFVWDLRVGYETLDVAAEFERDYDLAGVGVTTGVKFLLF